MLKLLEIQNIDVFDVKKSKLVCVFFKRVSIHNCFPKKQPPLPVYYSYFFPRDFALHIYKRHAPNFFDSKSSIKLLKELCLKKLIFRCCCCCCWAF
jgi:hypothetical protein